MANLTVIDKYRESNFTKSGIAERAGEAIAHVLNHEDALQAYVQVKAGQAYLKLIEDGLKDAALNGASRADSATLYGAKVTTPTRTTYDYSNDAQWTRMTAQIESLTAARKAREEFLASVATLMEHGNEAPYDPETGAQVEPPRIVSQREVLTVTLAK